MGVALNAVSISGPKDFEIELQCFFVVTLNNDTLVTSLPPSHYFQRLEWLQIYLYAKCDDHTTFETGLERVELFVGSRGFSEVNDIWTWKILS